MLQFLFTTQLNVWSTSYYNFLKHSAIQSTPTEFNENVQYVQYK